MVKNGSRSSYNDVYSYAIDFLLLESHRKLAANQDHHSVDEIQAKIGKCVCKNDCKVRKNAKFNGH